MISLLERILCAILGLAVAIGSVFVTVINVAFGMVGIVVQWLVNLLPEIPDPPAPPEEGILAIINWAVPIAGMLTFAGVALIAWGIFQGFQVALRWLKAL